MKVIKVETFEKDGMEYRKTVYDNGTEVTEAISQDIPEPEQELTDEEIIQAEILLNQMQILNILNGNTEV